MIVQLISSIKSRLAPPSYVIGRWANDETFSKKKLKVDYANEDHCFCDDYLQNKLKEQNQPNFKPQYFANRQNFVMWELDKLHLKK